jgi:hypothetical protein
MLLCTVDFMSVFIIAGELGKSQVTSLSEFLRGNVLMDLLWFSTKCHKSLTIFLPMAELTVNPTRFGELSYKVLRPFA